MKIEIIEEPTDALADYGRISIAFQVTTRYRIDQIDNGLGGFQFREEEVKPAYVKDYDGHRGEGPTRWAKRWDISHWGIISAFVNGSRIGGAVVAHDTAGSDFLEGRKEIAALWDIRVHPDFRGQGIGSELFQRAVSCARDKGCRLFKIETQNINVSACKFYARQGCELGAINRYAYPELPEEIQLIWYKPIG